MVKEIRHKSLIGSELTETTDWEGLDTHYLTGGANNDILTYVSALAKIVGKTPAEIAALIDHGLLIGLADDDHTQYIRHALATAINDFLVASGAGAYTKKTLAETLTILGKAVAGGLASLDANSKVVQDPATDFIPLAQKAAASGLASLNASSLVVQKPADRLGVANLEWTSNKLLKGAGAGVNPIEIDVPSSGDWEVVSEVNIDSAVDYVDFTGLDGNTDKFYELFLNMTNPTGSAALIYLYVNGDTTPTNYYEQYLNANGTAVAADRANDPTVAYMPSGDRTMSRITITRDPDGYFKYLLSMSYQTGSAVILQLRAGSKTGTVANITSLRVASSVAGAIGVGSNLLLCKPRTG